MENKINEINKLTDDFYKLIPSFLIMRNAINKIEKLRPCIDKDILYEKYDSVIECLKPLDKYAQSLRSSLNKKETDNDANILNDKVEVWKNIADFPCYQVSTFGRVRSLDRTITKNYKNESSYVQDVKGQMLKLSLWRKEKKYVLVSLSKNHKSYRKFVHELVAETFIPNPDKKQYIKHLDGNIQNNNINNLKWIDENELCVDCDCDVIAKYDKNGNLLATYSSIEEASKETGIDINNILFCLNNKDKTSSDYTWHYIKKY